MNKMYKGMIFCLFSIIGGSFNVGLAMKCDSEVSSKNIINNNENVLAKWYNLNEEQISGIARTTLSPIPFQNLDEEYRNEFNLDKFLLVNFHSPGRRLYVFPKSGLVVDKLGCTYIFGVNKNEERKTITPFIHVHLREVCDCLKELKLNSKNIEYYLLKADPECNDNSCDWVLQIADSTDRKSNFILTPYPLSGQIK